MKWISNSINESKFLKDHYKLHSIDIIVKDALPDNIDIDFVIKYVTARTPQFLLTGVDITSWQDHKNEKLILGDLIESILKKDRNFLLDLGIYYNYV